jgi:hypothetical protein
MPMPMTLDHGSEPVPACQLLAESSVGQDDADLVRRTAARLDDRPLDSSRPEAVDLDKFIRGDRLSDAPAPLDRPGSAQRSAA